MRGSSPSGNTMRRGFERARSFKRSSSAVRSSVSEEPAVFSQAFHVIANGLQSGGDRNREHEASGIPQEAPEHQGESHDQRIQMDPRSHNDRIQDVEGDEMQRDDNQAGDQESRSGSARRERREDRRKNRKDQPGVRDQAQQAADDPNQERIWQADHREHGGTDRGEYEREHEVADNERARHTRDSLNGSGHRFAVRHFEETQKTAVDMIAPAQHEVDQQRHERRHRHNLIESAQLTVDVVEDGIAVVMDAHFRNCSGDWRGRNRRSDDFAALAHVRRRGRDRLFRVFPNRYQEVGGRILQGLDMVRHAADKPREVLFESRNVAGYSGDLVVDGETREIDAEERDNAHDEARQRSRKANPHQQHDERLENKRRDDGIRRRNKDYPGPIKDADYVACGDDG